MIQHSTARSNRIRRVIATPHGELVFGERCLIMGILNVTPDSFSDGGRFAKTHVAVQHAIAMAAAGADVIDIGGESTRPGSVGVSDAEQLARVLPVIRETRISGLTLPISIDTRSAAVAAAALDAGADMVNDVSAARHDPAMAGMLAQSGAAFVAMHMLGTPENMQNQPQYKNVVQNVSAFFEERAAALLAVGVDVANKMIVDPGIGFGKTLAHNLTLLRESSAAFGVRWPVLIGPSRKRFIGDLAGESNPSTHGAAKSNSRLMGTAAAVASCALSGVDMVRVHDVADMVAVIRVCESIAPS